MPVFLVAFFSFRACAVETKTVRRAWDTVLRKLYKKSDLFWSDTVRTNFTQVYSDLYSWLYHTKWWSYCLKINCLAFKYCTCYRLKAKTFFQIAIGKTQTFALFWNTYHWITKKGLKTNVWVLWPCRGPPQPLLNAIVSRVELEPATYG